MIRERKKAKQIMNNKADIKDWKALAMNYREKIKDWKDLVEHYKEAFSILINAGALETESEHSGKAAMEKYEKGVELEKLILSDSFSLSVKRKILLAGIEEEVIKYRESEDFWGWYPIYTHYYVNQLTNVNHNVDNLWQEDLEDSMRFILLILKLCDTRLIKEDIDGWVSADELLEVMDRGCRTLFGFGYQED